MSIQQSHMDKENLVVEIFTKMAGAISEQYAHEIAAIRLIHNSNPSFDEFKAKLLQLDKALTDKAIWLIELYKKSNDADHEQLTEDCKKVIAETVEQFIKKL
jgi:hypothetical protein